MKFPWKKEEKTEQPQLTDVALSDDVLAQIWGGAVMEQCHPKDPPV